MEVFRLAGRTRKDRITTRQQSPNRSAMQLLDVKVLVGERPKGPDFVEHDYEPAGSSPLPLDQCVNQIAWITNDVEPVGAVLNKDLVALRRQLFDDRLGRIA